MVMLLLPALAITSLFTAVQAQTAAELLNNADFEDPGGWSCAACTLTRTNQDAFQGSWNGEVTARTKAFGSVTQVVRSVEQNESYYFTVHVKLLNNGSSGDVMGPKVKSVAQMTYEDGTVKYHQFGVTPYMRSDRGWVKVGGDFTTDDKAVKQVRLYLHIDDTSVEYMVDTASLTQIPRSPQWKEEANQRIDNIRKQALDIRVTTEGGYDPAGVEIEVSMDRHHFAFGSALKSQLVTQTTEMSEQYMQVFYDNFEWAVFANSMKWKQMEAKQANVNFVHVDAALQQLRDHGITVRGHCIMWETLGTIPEWLKLLAGDAMRSEMQRRFNYLLKKYEDDIVHWDVNNEQLHGSYFEKQTGDPNLMDWMFKEVHRQIPGTKLMLNDFSVLSAKHSTMALMSSAKEMLARGVPVHGIGAQSHFEGGVPPNILNRRIDALSEAGLPIWVTELDIVGFEDREERADMYERLLRIFFSRQEVEGVILWGFWDQYQWRPEGALWEGWPMQPNAAGQRYMDLVKGEWTTNEVVTPSSGDETFSTRAFQGLYSVNIKYNGASICQRNATYDVPVGTDATWTINVEQC